MALVITLGLDTLAVECPKCSSLVSVSATAVLFHSPENMGTLSSSDRFPYPFCCRYDSLGFHTFGYTKGTEMICGTNMKTDEVP